jgi:hypothetical protein
MLRLQQLNEKGIFKKASEQVDGILSTLKEASDSGKQWMEPSYFK